MQANPFARARNMMAAISAAMALATDAQRQLALNAVGPYVSRGHGRGNGIRLGSSSRTVAQGKRAAVKARNVKRHKAAARRA